MGALQHSVRFLRNKTARGKESSQDGKAELDWTVEGVHVLCPTARQPGEQWRFWLLLCPKLEEWGQDHEIQEPAGNFSKLHKGL